jgi:hypothetical protein
MRNPDGSASRLASPSTAVSAERMISCSTPPRAA